MRHSNYKSEPVLASLLISEKGLIQRSEKEKKLRHGSRQRKMYREGNLDKPLQPT